MSAAKGYLARHEPITDPKWPNGARIAVNLTADFDAMLLRRLKNEPPMQLAKGEFGGRVGIWRLIELFDSHGIKGTIFTPGRICELYPQALAAAAKSGHEITDHMWEHHVPKDPELERDHLTRSTEALAKIAGYRGVGTRSGHSPKLLRELGYIYRSSGSASHMPHYVRDADGPDVLINLPFHYAIDDAMFYSFAWLGTPNSAQRISDPERVMDMWWEAFLQQHATGKRLPQHLHAPLRLRPCVAHADDGQAHHADEGEGRRVVRHLRGHGAALHRSAAPQRRLELRRAPCPGKTTTPSPTSAPSRMGSCAGRMENPAA
jgi:peptidoglycan/xylan/chitin deacetylase (PgdA/CDA1 family)